MKWDRGQGCGGFGFTPARGVWGSGYLGRLLLALFFSASFFDSAS